MATEPNSNKPKQDEKSQPQPSNKEIIEKSPSTQATERNAGNTPIAPLAPKDNINPSRLKQDVLKALEGAPLSPIQQAKLDEVLAQHSAGVAQARNPYQENPHINAPHVLPAVLSPIVKETTSPGTMDRLEPTLAKNAEPNPVTAGEIPEVKMESAKQGEVPVVQPQGNIQPASLKPADKK